MAETVNADLRSRVTRDGLTDESQAILRAAYARNGLQGYLMQLKVRVLPLYRSNPGGVYHLARICASLNETDEAFRWLLRVEQDRSEWFAVVNVDPRLQALHTDARFAEILRSVGIGR